MPAAALPFALALALAASLEPDAGTSPPPCTPPCTPSVRPQAGSRGAPMASLDPDGGTLGMHGGALHSDLVRFHGNHVMPDEVYLAVLQLPEGAPADAQTAEEVRSQLEAFLHRAGYELASVEAKATGGVIEILINEGRLEKVVFRGRLTLRTLRLQLALELPHEVFNRPALQRQLRELAASVGISNAWFELVPTANIKHLGPQLEALPSIKGIELLHARQPYELHIFFAENEWDTGLGLDLRSGYVDGLELGINYQGRSGLLEDDRWRLAASGGAGLRLSIVPPPPSSVQDRYYPAFSRTFAEGRWFSPRIIGDFRPFIWVWGDLVGRQRRDIKLEGYNAATAAASLHMEFEPAEGLRLSLGGGWEWRRLFGGQPAQDWELPPRIAEAFALPDRMRPFALLGADLVFDTGAARWDRRHALTIDVRPYFGINDPMFGYGSHRYQKVTAFGWHDLWVRTRGKWLWGEVAFHNEEPVGEYLHGLFGEDFVNRIVNLNLEFRFSITRDLVKLSLFHDLAAFGEIDRTTGQQKLLVANSFGPGLHTLIEGMLQLDIYVAFGFRSDRKFDTGVSALLLKVF